MTRLLIFEYTKTAGLLILEYTKTATELHQNDMLSSIAYLLEDHIIALINDPNKKIK